MDDIELIDKAKAGNKSAMNTLITENLSILKGYVIKMTQDKNIAQDIVQDTLLKAVLNINKFEPRAKFSTWLIKIATNVFRDYLRHSKTTECIDESIEDTGISVEDLAIEKLQYIEIKRIIMKLSYEKREVFILKHYYGYKYEEIAEILNCPIGTVRSRLHNAVAYIMKELERLEMI